MQGPTFRIVLAVAIATLVLAKAPAVNVGHEFRHLRRVAKTV